MKQMYDVIFCVLTYRNSLDAVDFLKSVRGVCGFSYRVILVNSYYDDESRDRVARVAIDYDCDFLNVPNKGYGAGNNRGIEYALENYDFNYIVISNPDIIVKRFDIDSLRAVPPGTGIIAPQIVCRTKKQQNPATAKNSRFANRLLYLGFKNNNRLFLYGGIAWNKLVKLKSSIFNRGERRIFQCHGSFVIFKRTAIATLLPVYDEKIFMFCEELDLAYKSRALGVESCFVPDISVYHKEDGSIKLSNFNTFEAERKSFIYCTEKWKSENVKF